MNLETKRLLIKPVDRESLVYIFKYLRDISLNTIVPIDSSYNIKKFLDFNEKIKLFNSLGYFSVFKKQNYEIIGLVSVVPKYLGENLINELGYLISRKYQNNNFASEVILNMLDFIFSNTNIEKIYSLVGEENKASKHILENKMKFDFLNVIFDSNGFKSIYTLDKLKFKCMINKFNYC